MNKSLGKIILSLAVLGLPGGVGAGADTAGDGFRPIGYREVLTRALESNFDIRLAEIDRRIARQLIPASLSVYDTRLEAGFDYLYDEFKQASQFSGELAKTAGYGLDLSRRIPWGTEFRLGFHNSYFYSDSGFNTINPSAGSLLELSLRQPLLKNFGGRITRGEVETARLDAAGYNLAAWEAAEAALARAARAYWDLAEIHEEVRREEELEEQARYLFELTRNHLEMGMVENVDLVAAEANLRIRESEVIYDRERLVSASRFLKYLIDDSGPGDLEPADPLDLPEDDPGLSLEKCLSTALENRWDYLRARENLEKKEIAVAINENSRWPELDLVGSFARNGLDREWGEAAGEIFSEDNPRYYVGVEFTHFLENRRAQSATEAARLEQARALVEIKKLEKEIFTRVDRELRTLRTALDLARREAVIERLEAEKLAEEEQRFRSGRSSSKTIIDYQNDLLRARIRSVSARAAYHRARIDLAVAQGVFLRRELGLEEEGL